MSTTKYHYLDLRQHYTWGMSLLQLMLAIGGSSLIITAVYHYFF